MLDPLRGSGLLRTTGQNIVMERYKMPLCTVTCESQRMTSNARMHSAAYYRRVTALMNLAAEKFEVAAHKMWDAPEFSMSPWLLRDKIMQRRYLEERQKYECFFKCRLSGWSSPSVPTRQRRRMMIYKFVEIRTLCLLM